MFRREGRVGQPEHEVETHGREARPRLPVHRNWESSAVLMIGIAILVLCVIAGLNWMTSQFPWMH